MCNKLSDKDTTELLSKAANTLEAVTNLTFLTAFDAERPKQVREYMRLADEQLRSFAEVVHKHQR
jgi:hypothetical protein